MTFSITDETVYGIRILNLAGHLDSTRVNAFGQRLQAYINAGEQTILLDLANLVAISSSGLRALLVADDESRENSISLVLCNINKQVQEPFELSGLIDIFNIHPSRGHAFAKLKRSQVAC